MKIVSSGDLHVGTKHQGTYPQKDRRAITTRVLYDMLRICQVNGSRCMILNGDVLDEAYPDLQTLLELHWALMAVRAEGVTVYWIRGNHEVHIKSQLDVNVMHLFQNVCQVVVEPQSFTSDTSVVMMIPWYPDERLMRRLYDEAALLVHRDPRHCVLFTHAGLKEGRISPSNRQLPQDIAVCDLHPEVWDAVFLSDYHAHQMLAENVCYMGAPIPHTFGDWSIVGPWLIDTDAAAYRAVDIVAGDDGWFEGMPPFRSPRYPRFQRWSHQDPSTMPEWPIDLEDYNEIRVHPALKERVQALHPGCRVLPPEDIGFSPAVVIDGVRLREEDIRTSTGLVEAWLKYRGKSDDIRLKEIGLQLLG